MRISDWSSDVCSSDLNVDRRQIIAGLCQRDVERACQIAGIGSLVAARIARKDGEGLEPVMIPRAERNDRRIETAGDADQDRTKLRGPCGDAIQRSEGHTTELQSLMRISYAVC